MKYIYYNLNQDGSSKPKFAECKGDFEFFKNFVSNPRVISHTDYIPLVSFCTLKSEEVYPDGTPRRKLVNLDYSYARLS